MTKLIVAFATVLQTRLKHLTFTILANVEEKTTKKCLVILSFTIKHKIRLNKLRPRSVPTAIHILSKNVFLELLGLLVILTTIFD